MQVLVLLSLVAFCASVPTIGIRITVEEDGAITFIAPRHDVIISRSVSSPRKINILVKNIYGTTDTLEVDETFHMRTTDLSKLLDTKYINDLGEDYTQIDILDSIFRKYEGTVDDLTYNKILKKIEILVQNGVLKQEILTVLKNLNTLRRTEEIKNKLFESNDVMTKVLEPKVMTKDVVMPLEDGVVLMHEVSEVIPVEGHGRLPQYLNGQQVGLKTIVPLQRDIPIRTMGIQKYWNMNNQDLMDNTMTPAQRFQMLLQQNRQQRQYQQGLMGEQYVPQQRMLSQKYMTPLYLQRDQEVQQSQYYQPTMEQMYQQQLGQTEMTPLNRYLVNLRLTRGQQSMVIPQQNMAQMHDQMYNKMMKEQTRPQHVMYQVPQHMMNKHMMDQDTMTEKMMEQKMMDKQMMDQEMKHQEIMDEEMMTQKMMQQRMMNEKMMEQKMMNEKMMEQHMMNEKMMEQQMMYQKMMEQQMLKQKIMQQQMMNQKMMGHQMMGHQMMNDEIMYQPQRVSMMGQEQVPTQRVY